MYDDKINYWLLGVTIFISMTLSGLTVGYAGILWAEYQAEAALEQMTQELKAATQKRKEKAYARRKENERKAEQSRKASIERAKKQNTVSDRQSNARRINQQVCSDWSKRYSSEKTEYNKVMRDQACKRVGLRFN